MKPWLLLLLINLIFRLSGAELPVRNGLILHLDAASQLEKRRAAGLPALTKFGPVDFLICNASGARAVQVLPQNRPVFHADANAAYLKFDGKDDFFALHGLKKDTEVMTLFVLAAPRTNAGNFSGMFASASVSRNDYTSGLNLDFGPSPSKELSVLNVESAGSTGFLDLLTPGFFNAAERPFADFHLITVRSQPGKAGTVLFLDGFKGGERERGDSKIGLEEIVVGGRFYSNDPNHSPFAQGFFDGSIAEVLVYDRALTDAELKGVEQMLLAKTVSLNALLQGAKGHALEPVKYPPVVQMLVPGFTVHELPLKLSNINNVRYRHDGKVVALGYDGRIHLLSDTDGDGLEDKADIFWNQTPLRSPIGMALTTKDDPRGDGVFVGSKGKISLILDTNRDGRGDEEKILASGWPEPFHNVDVLGLAVDPKDGSVYFGFGCANFVEAYLIDKATGQSKYTLQNERGTIQRISPDFSTRETVCTGVRFTCALAFNRHGDLFATDQEGATWLSNGNPFDELLHIEKGKHYGFPPRHPKHLPDVRDEPAVVEYGPQHQSTVGMVFNEGVNGGHHFGPAHWEGDAIVCGESRGKIWRTKLAKTPLGYVGQNHLIASLTMLTVDACVTPQADLLVACHSGPPDWGTGPAGEGRLFKIKYTGRDLPQPVVSWASGPDEFRIAFDRPLDPSDWATAKEQVQIEAGEHVGAGDRFEAIRPGYQIVRDQMASSRRWVDLLGLNLTEDQRTMVLRVPRQAEPVTYAITLPLPVKWKQSNGIEQHPQIDLSLTLNGLAASLQTPNGEVRTILPYASLAASSELTKGSAEHGKFIDTAKPPGCALSLRGLVDVSNPFVPLVQPGAKLDWDMASDSFASKTFSVQTDFLKSSGDPVSTSESGRFRSIEVSDIKNAPVKANGLLLTDGSLRHPVSPAKVRVPWSSETQQKFEGKLAEKRSDVKGNWLAGRRVFFREAGCATCHTVFDEGTAFGPDLSNLIHRDRESVLQDIIQPSATINPDQAGSMITLADGTGHLGVLRKLDTAKLVLGMPAGVELEFPRASVKSIEPLKHSLMPPGLVDQLTLEQLEDLMTFLLSPALEAAPSVRTDPPAPKPRKIKEVIDVLGSVPQPPLEPSAMNILLVAGPKDHGPEEHDYPLWLERWSRLLALADNVKVQTAVGFPTVGQLNSSDVSVFYNANPGWNPDKAALMDDFHKRGAGAVYIHYAVDGGKHPDLAAERIGLAFTLGSKFRHGDFDLVFSQPDHPITRGFPTLHFTDETYWNMRGDVSRLNVIGTSMEDGKPQPELWTLERNNSRIVGCIPGHYTWTFDDPLFRLLVFRSICWAAKEANLDRFAELTTIGARVLP